MSITKPELYKKANNYMTNYGGVFGLLVLIAIIAAALAYVPVINIIAIPLSICTFAVALLMLILMPFVALVRVIQLHLQYGQLKD